MADSLRTDVEYTYESTRMLGYLCTDGPRDEPRPGVLIVHGGFGITDPIKRNVERVAALGYMAFAADLWGERWLPASPAEFNPVMARLTGDHDRWMGRLRAAHQVLAAQPGVDASRVAATGYCFGGSSVLEYARTGGPVRGAVSFHGGLETVSPDWKGSAALREGQPRILICTGADDPMAPADALLELEAGLTAADVDWEVDVYSGTNHAFTFTDSPNYQERSAERSWDAMRLLLAEVFGA